MENKELLIENSHKRSESYGVEKIQIIQIRFLLVKN